jgi:hypothetical protein
VEPTGILPDTQLPGVNHTDIPASSRDLFVLCLIQADKETQACGLWLGPLEAGGRRFYMNRINKEQACQYCPRGRGALPYRPLAAGLADGCLQPGPVGRERADVTGLDIARKMHAACKHLSIATAHSAMTPSLPVNETKTNVQTIFTASILPSPHRAKHPRGKPADGTIVRLRASE